MSLQENSTTLLCLFESKFTEQSEPFRQATGETAIRIVGEQLVVGRREVERGGVRVHSRIVATPAAANVTLSDEKVLVERRPVHRVATAAN